MLHSRAWGFHSLNWTISCNCSSCGRVCPSRCVLIVSICRIWFLLLQRIRLIATTCLCVCVRVCVLYPTLALNGLFSSAATAAAGDGVKWIWPFWKCCAWYTLAYTQCATIYFRCRQFDSFGISKDFQLARLFTRHPLLPLPPLLTLTLSSLLPCKQFIWRHI